MSIACNGTKSSQVLLSDFQTNWSTVEDQRKRKLSLVFGVKHSTMLVEFKIVCSDTGLNWLISCSLNRGFKVS